MTNDWKRVGEYARRRRKELGLGQADIAKRHGPSPALVRQVENGYYAAEMQPAVRRAYERALEWRAGSIDVLLAEEPTHSLVNWTTLETKDPGPRDITAGLSGTWLEDADGARYFQAVSLSGPDAGDTRVELNFWPGRGNRVNAMGLIQSATDIHKKLVEFVIEGGDGNEGSTAPNTAADSELSAAPDELPAAAKEGLIEEPGEFNT